MLRRGCQALKDQKPGKTSNGIRASFVSALLQTLHMVAFFTFSFGRGHGMAWICFEYFALGIGIFGFQAWWWEAFAAPFCERVGATGKH